jgi:hypothetical protein
LAGIVSSKSGRVKHARNAPTWQPVNRGDPDPKNWTI